MKGKFRKAFKKKLESLKSSNRGNAKRSMHIDKKERLLKGLSSG